MRKLSLFFFIITMIFLCPTARAERAIPNDNLAIPVLLVSEVKTESGVHINTGSGFYYSTGSVIYLITAAHVIFDLSTGNLLSKHLNLLSYPRDSKETGKNVYQLDLEKLGESRNILRHKVEDVVAIKIAEVNGKTETGFKIKGIPGTSVIETTPSGILTIAPDGIKFFKDILISNPIYVFGYPTSIGLKEMPQIDRLLPLLRFGIIGGTNPTRRTIILDCPVYPGNSGGPVLEVEDTNLQRQYRVIGVISQFVPFVETWENKTHKYININVSNSGYAVAVSMDSVIELIESSVQIHN